MFPFLSEVARMRRYELTDEQYQMIQDLLPANGKRGGQWNDHRTTLNGMFWILLSGAQWREMPERHGRCKSVYVRFNRWRRDGTIDKILRRLQVHLDKDGRIDWDLWCIDGTNVRASRSAAGQCHESRHVEPVLNAVRELDEGESPAGHPL
jgi:transposase